MPQAKRRPTPQVVTFFRNSAKLSTVVESGTQTTMERNTKDVSSSRLDKKTKSVVLTEEKPSNSSSHFLTVRHNLSTPLPKRQNKGEDAKNARKQVIKMLILVIVLFLICWGPKLIFSLTLKLLSEYQFTPELYFIRLIFNLIPFVHSCINPLIYSFMSKNFRRSTQRLLHRLCSFFGCKCVECRDPSAIPLRSTASARTRTFKGADSVNSSNYCHLSDAPQSRCTEVDCISVM